MRVKREHHYRAGNVLRWCVLDDIMALFGEVSITKIDAEGALSDKEVE